MAQEQDLGWYSVRCVFRCRTRRRWRIYEERINVWCAHSFEEAISKAEAEAAEYAKTWEAGPVRLVLLCPGARCLPDRRAREGLWGQLRPQPSTGRARTRRARPRTAPPTLLPSWSCPAPAPRVPRAPGVPQAVARSGLARTATGSPRSARSRDLAAPPRLPKPTVSRPAVRHVGRLGSGERLGRPFGCGYARRWR